MTADAAVELKRRVAVWQGMKDAEDAGQLAPSRVAELRIHRGEQGIYRDLKSTGSITSSGVGATVGILYTGSTCADNLAVDGIVYHYPQTNRAGRRDENEIAATKICHALELPVFVVITPTAGASTRDVRLGWIIDYDDDARLFLIRFGDAKPPTSANPPADAAFNLFERRPSSQTSLRVPRPNQWRFRFDVFQRYGPSCALCDLKHTELLEAAHLCPVHADGSDDPRNGLVLCINHHRAIDKHLAVIDPETRDVLVGDGRFSLMDLGITRGSIAHLPKPPHVDALRWLWKRSALCD